MTALLLLHIHPLVNLCQRIQLHANTNTVVCGNRTGDPITSHSPLLLPSPCGEPVLVSAECCPPPPRPPPPCSPAAAGEAAPPNPAPGAVSSSGEVRRHAPAPPSRPPLTASPLGPLQHQIPQGDLTGATAGKQTFDSICFYCLSACAFRILQLLSGNNLGNGVCSDCHETKMYLVLK